MFATDRGAWKVLTRVYDDTFPGKDAAANEKAIQGRLKDNPKLQLSAVAAELQAAGSGRAGPSGAAPGEDKAGSGGEAQRPAAPGTVPGTSGSRPKVSTAFNDSPEHRAVVKELKEEGKDQVLETATSVGMSKGRDFASVNVSYSSNGKPAAIELYLFKEDGTWVAYLELPASKEHPAVFSTLARRYCLTLYKQVQSASLVDDSWRGGDARRRDVNVVCSELINNKWKDHRLTLVYEFNDARGWHITGQASVRQSPPKPVQKGRAAQPAAEPARPGTAAKAVWTNAGPAMDDILKFIGGSPKPVYVHFGTTGGGFIQFHYVMEDGSKDIKTVEWLGGKLKGPQVSRLVKPCPAMPLKEVDFGQVTRIFAELNKKARPGEMVNVNLGRRSAKGCKEPVWQGVATSAKRALTITYSLDGRQTDIQDYSF
jgi:hypothetical protein